MSGLVEITGGGGLPFILRFDIEGKGKDELQAIGKIVKQITADVGNAGASNQHSMASGFKSILPKVESLTGRLGPIGKLFGSITHEAESLVSTLGGAGVAAAGAAAGFLALEAGKSVLNALNSAGQTFVSWGMQALGLMTHLGKGLMEELSPIEQSIIRIKALGNTSLETARHQVEMAQEVVQFTPMLERQVVSLASALTAGKVSLEAYTDATGKVVTLNDLATQGFARLDKTTQAVAGTMKITATSLLADLAAMTGQAGEQIDFFVRGVERALATGSVRMLTDQIPATILKAVFGTTGQMTIKAQKAIDNLYKYLKEKQAIGTAAMASSTYQGIISNFHDLKLAVAKAVGGMPGEGGFYDKLRDGLAQVFADISILLKDTEWQKGIREVFTPVINLMLKAINAVGKTIAFLMEVAGKHPTLTKLALGVVGVSIAFGVLIGSVILLTTAFGAFMAVATIGYAFFMLFVSWAMVLTPIILTLTAVFLPLVVAIGALGVALLAATGFMVYFTIQSKPFQEWWEKAKLLINATREAISNWGGETTRISAETAEKLENAGLLGFFVKSMQVIRVWQVRFNQIMEAISDGWEFMKNRMMGPAAELGKAFSGLVSALGMVFKVQTNVAAGTTASSAAGREYYNTTMKIIEVVTTLAEILAKVVTLFLDIGRTATLTFVKMKTLAAEANVVLKPIVATLKTISAIPNITKWNKGGFDEIVGSWKEAIDAPEKARDARGEYWDALYGLGKYAPAPDAQPEEAPDPNVMGGLEGLGETYVGQPGTALSPAVLAALTTGAGGRGPREPIRVQSTNKITLEVDKKVLAEVVHKSDSDDKDSGFSTP